MDLINLNSKNNQIKQQQKHRRKTPDTKNITKRLDAQPDLTLPLPFLEPVMKSIHNTKLEIMSSHRKFEMIN